MGSSDLAPPTKAAVRGLRPRDRPEAPVLRHRPDGAGPRSAPPRARGRQADPRRRVVRDLRRRAVCAALPDARRPARPRLGRSPRGDQRAVGRERERGRAGPAFPVQRPALQGRSGRAARVRRADVEHRHAAPRCAGHSERLRPDLPRCDRGALRRVPRPARPTSSGSSTASRPTRGRRPRRSARASTPPRSVPTTACRGAGRPRRHAAVSRRCSTPPSASSRRRSGPSRARSRPPTGSSARVSTGRPSRLLPSRAANCPRFRRCCSPVTATCRRRSPGRSRSWRSPPAAR